MSSYTTGVYEIAEAVRAQIRAQVNRELTTLNALRAESQALQAAHDAREQELAQREASRRQQEQTEDRQAREAAITADARHIALQKEANLLLSDAAQRISQMDDDTPEKTSLMDKLRCMQDSLALFDVTEQSIANIRQLVQQVIPQTMQRIYERKEKAKLEKEVAERLKVESAVTDRSQQFVSLSVQGGQNQAIADPWKNFVTRVQALVVRQEEFGGYGAAELQEEMAGLAAAQRSLFILEHSADVEQWEHEAESYAQDAEQKQERYAEYLTLYEVCSGFAPEKIAVLPKSASKERIAKEHARLLEMYVEYQNHRYLEKHFRRVFEAHGMTFEAMKADRETVNIEFSMDHESAVRVFRSDSGAFEMRFVSRGNSESQDHRRRATEKAHSFCSMMPEIYADLAACGIIFDQRAVQEPSEECIVYENVTQTAVYHQKKLKTQQLN